MWTVCRFNGHSETLHTLKPEIHRQHFCLPFTKRTFYPRLAQGDPMNNHGSPFLRDESFTLYPLKHGIYGEHVALPFCETTCPLFDGASAEKPVLLVQLRCCLHDIMTNPEIRYDIVRVGVTKPTHIMITNPFPSYQTQKGDRRGLTGEWKRKLVLIIFVRV